MIILGKTIALDANSNKLEKVESTETNKYFNA